MAKENNVSFSVEMAKRWWPKKKEQMVKPTTDEIKQMGFRNATEERNAKLLIAQAKHEERRRKWRAERNARMMSDAEKAAQADAEKWKNWNLEDIFISYYIYKNDQSILCCLQEEAINCDWTHMQMWLN